MEHDLQGEANFDGQVGVKRLPAPANATGRGPFLCHIRIEPNRQITALEQSLVILTPVRNAIFGWSKLVAALSIEFVRQRADPRLLEAGPLSDFANPCNKVLEAELPANPPGPFIGTALTAGRYGLR